MTRLFAAALLLAACSNTGGDTGSASSDDTGDDDAVAAGHTSCPDAVSHYYEETTVAAGCAVTNSLGTGHEATESDAIDICAADRIAANAYCTNGEYEAWISCLATSVACDCDDEQLAVENCPFAN